VVIHVVLVLVIDTAVATESWQYCSRFPRCMGELITHYWCL